MEPCVRLIEVFRRGLRCNGGVFMSQASSSAQQQLKRLGAGGSEDRLRFRLVLKVMVRCLPLLKEVKWHLVGIILSAATLALSLLRPAFRIYDMFWTRVL